MLWLWLWHSPGAAALIQLLAWELPHAVGVALKRQKKKEKKRKKERERIGFHQDKNVRKGTPDRENGPSRTHRHEL